MEFCISDLVTGIARGLPDRLAIVTPETRTTWRELDARTSRLAAGLVAAGLACRGDTAHIATLDARIGSVQDHVGLLCGNCPEYIETMAACFRARLVPVNVNYRYTAAELAYVIENADLRAVVYQTRFGSELADAIEMCGAAPALFHVDDGSPAPPLDGSVALADLLDAPAPAVSLPEATGDDRYILYTGGTTGWPKGAVWRQEDWYFAALGGALRGFRTPADAVARAVGSRPLPGIASSPFMHGGGHWAAFVILLQGGTLVLPPSPDHLDPAGIWSTVEAERVVYLQLIGDAFLGPLVDELERGDYDVSSLRFVMSSGAIASPARKAALLDRIPRLRILDTVGSSESGATAMNESTCDRPPDTAGAQRFALEPTADVLSLDVPYRRADVGEVGWLAQRGRVPLGYYKDPVKTEATFPVVDGVRCSIPGDQAVRTADGEILLLGRGSFCINTGGEKVYPEEVEQVLKSHPAVEDALVAGFTHPRWGEAVGAVVAVRDGREVGWDVLEAHLRTQLAGYKIPKRWVSSPAIRRNQMGKPDYAWARERLVAD
ncbi:MAG: AMP-binding protein [Acidimicrobiia bacterium]|nr:AMP-binding protein [Acidimicrobiia bacterium]